MGWGARGGEQACGGNRSTPAGERVLQVAAGRGGGEGTAVSEFGEGEGSRVLAEVAASPLTVRKLWEIVAVASGLT